MTKTKRPAETAKPDKTPPTKEDFATVARELDCDEDKKRFERQLEKIAKAKVTEPIKGSRRR